MTGRGRKKQSPQLEFVELGRALLLYAGHLWVHRFFSIKLLIYAASGSSFPAVLIFYFPTPFFTVLLLLLLLLLPTTTTTITTTNVSFFYYFDSNLRLILKACVIWICNRQF